MEGEVVMVPLAIGLPADTYDVAMMLEPTDEGGGHRIVAEDVAPFVEALVAGQRCRAALVAPTYELKEKRRAGPQNWQIAYLVDCYQTRKDERAQSAREMPRLRRFVEPRVPIGERRIVLATSPHCGRDGETDGEMRFADAG